MRMTSSFNTSALRATVVILAFAPTTTACARYYAITPVGRAYLKAQTTQWLTYADTVTGILTGAVKAT